MISLRSIPGILMILLTFGNWAVSAEVIDGIAARVGDQLVLWSDVRRAQKSASLSSLGEGDLATVRERLIEDILVADEAARLGRVIDEPQVIQAIERFAAQNSMTLESLRYSLQQEGVAWIDYQEVVRRQLVRAEVVQMRVRNTIAVSESDISSAYRERYLATLQFEIVLEPKTGGDLIDFGWVEPGELREDIRALLTTGDQLGVRGEVDIENTTYLVVVRQTRWQGGPPLEEVRDEIREQLFQERLERAFQNWLAQVKNQAFVERSPLPE